MAWRSRRARSAATYAVNRSTERDGMTKLSRVDFDVQNAAGDLVEGATIQVLSEATGALVPLFASRDGITGIAPANPHTLAAGVTATSFYLRGGLYRIIATKGFETVTRREVQVGTAKEVDIEQLLDTSKIFM